MSNPKFWVWFLHLFSSQWQNHFVLLHYKVQLHQEMNLDRHSPLNFNIKISYHLTHTLFFLSFVYCVMMKGYLHCWLKGLLYYITLMQSKIFWSIWILLNSSQYNPHHSYHINTKWKQNEIKKWKCELFVVSTSLNFSFNALSYFIPRMDACRNSILFSVRVPVLSQKINSVCEFTYTQSNQISQELQDKKELKFSK
jgi:hypothetical protein